MKNLSDSTRWSNRKRCRSADCNSNESERGSNLSLHYYYTHQWTWQYFHGMTHSSKMTMIFRICQCFRKYEKNKIKTKPVNNQIRKKEILFI